MIKTLSIILFLLSTFALNAQSKSGSNVLKSDKLEFRVNSVKIDSTYKNNAQVLAEIRKMFKSCDTESIDSIVITAYASPEGSTKHNLVLSRGRANSIFEYLCSIPSVAKEKITTKDGGEDWGGFYNAVVSNNSVPYKDKVLEILVSDNSFDQKKLLLKRINDGDVYGYLIVHIFPKLRSGAIVETISAIDVQKSIEVEQVKQPQKSIETEVMEEIVEQSVVNEVIAEPRIPQIESTKRILALKTNLLFDIASLINIEVEVPLSEHWSVAGEWMFPWWLWNEKQYCLQVLSGNIEARYWFKPNFNKQDESLTHHNPLTGWFIGLYGGGGYYDLERDKKGYQGEFFIATGISGGYSMPLSRNLNMEFSLGVGYMSTKYRYYEAQHSIIDEKWHLIRQHNGNYSWFGPTKAKISLVWYPHIKRVKRGGNK